MAIGKVDIFEQVFSNDGLIGAGYKVATYQGGTSTPLGTFSDAEGTANDNPIKADSAGRYQCWITCGVAYKFVLLTDDDVVLQTVDNYVLADPTGSGTSGSTLYSLLIIRPGANQENDEWVGGCKMEVAVTFPANFNGSQFKVPKQLPTASTAFVVKRNNATIGTVTYNTSGVGTATTSGGAPYSFAVGDEFDLYGPASADATIGDYAMTFFGEES